MENRELLWCDILADLLYSFGFNVCVIRLIYFQDNNRLNLDILSSNCLNAHAFCCVYFQKLLSSKTVSLDFCCKTQEDSCDISLCISDP